jgi:HAD superfamily hydrolase (TIGR01459 family)
MKLLSGISEVSSKYDYYIIDLWGVLHDGHDPYKGAVEALKKLKENNKKIVLLSNAPRRAVKAEAVLENLGFTRDMYDMLITSGEVTYNYVKMHPEMGKRYVYIGPEKDRHLLDGLNLEIVEYAGQADFAVATGFEGFGSLFSEKQAQLDDCLANKKLLLIANPDKKVVKQTGEEQICAGLMGDYYTQKGGTTRYFGKPYRNAYTECFKAFGVQKPEKTLCIGDSFHTDIAGANMLGAGSLFVAGGIHKKDVYLDNKIDQTQLHNLIKLEKQTPRYVIEEFCW